MNIVILQGARKSIFTDLHIDVPQFMELVSLFPFINTSIDVFHFISLLFRLLKKGHTASAAGQRIARPESRTSVRGIALGAP